MLRLHYAPRTISVAVAIVLEELGLDYTPVLVDFSKSEQTGDTYRAVNPKGRVPALETPKGVLTETGAILEYIAPDLVPADPFEAAKMRELMCYLSSTMHINHAHGYRGGRWADDPQAIAEMKRKMPETMAASCAYVAQALPLLAASADGKITLAEACLYVVLTWLPGDGVDIDDYPNLSAFQQKMDARQSIRTVRDMGML
ncbi:glutathione S-transferase family protein [Yoonia sp.]|uniref:glutathione S-transferase family protein n=1 Tax=Yoonia sp. TaxID=2212373 RepID=UPI0025DF834B|nr:glutathione S-transferase family protein [Yoonia sp.]